MQKQDFIHYAEEHYKSDGWSLYACCLRKLKSNEFSRVQIICAKMLYNYIDGGLMQIKNIDLPEKLRRKPSKQHICENKRKLGRNIEERSEHIDGRADFGHGEADLVIGQKADSDMELLTLAERKKRNFLILKIANKTAQAVMDAMVALQTFYGSKFGHVFKTIKTDNGSEFARMQALEYITDTLVYYTQHSPLGREAPMSGITV